MAGVRLRTIPPLILTGLGYDMDVRSLNILEFPKLLNYLAGFAVSEAGATACRNLEPKTSLDEVRTAQEFYAQGSLWLEHTGFKLANFPVLDGVLEFLEKSSQLLELDGLWTLRQVLGQAGELLETTSTEEKSSEFWPLFSAFCSRRPLPQKSINALRRCLTDDGYLKDESSPELMLVRSEIRRIHQQCSRKVNDFSKQYNLGQYLQDEYITLSSDRYVLPLKSNFKGRLQGIIHDYSQTGETCYFEPFFLVDLNNRLQELKQEEREEERKIFVYLSELLRSELEMLHTAYELMIEVDLLQAKKRMSSLYNGLPIDFGAEQPICLKSAQHPLLLLATKKKCKTESGAKVSEPVATDIMLHPGQQALVISGGNAGGKTVCLKTLGLNALMGMCAIPAPVGKNSTLPFWDNILAFIGDEQSLEDHVSTFTAQITLLSDSWESIRAGTLVILDEFGAGTDPAQGAALAQAVIDELLDKEACVFAATHFPALKAYALSREKVRAASVLFDPSTKKPLYKLVYDQVGASQALEVAREHGLSDAVLKKAEQYLLLDGEDTGRLIERLNQLAVEREQENLALKQKADKYEQKRKDLNERFAKERKMLFDDIQEQAQQVLADWKTSKLKHKQALKELSRLRTGLIKNEDDAATSITGDNITDFSRLKLGDTVVYSSWNKTGTVLELDSRRNKVRIDLSGVSIWVESSVLSFPGATINIKQNQTVSVTAPSAANFSLRLDLRGQRAEAALSELEQFIDSAILNGREQLEIIHGRGTGALRREIHTWLKNNSAIRTYALGNEEQGGDGVTFVELK